MAHLRADAQDNRDRILATARTLFAERGLDVGMREIARRAQVGAATLYRRFPTKQAVVEEAFLLELNACREIVVAASDDPDPWRGFASAVMGLVELNSRNRAFVGAFTSSTPVNDRLLEHRRELLHMLESAARRAQREGTLRADFSIADLVLVLQAGRGLAFNETRARPERARRFAELLLDAFRADPDTTAGHASRAALNNDGITSRLQR